MVKLFKITFSFSLLPSLPNLSMASNVSKNISCKLCHKPFKNKTNLEKHIQFVHFKEKPVLCNICGRKVSKQCLLRHIRCVHTNEKPFSCAVCNESFNRKDKLARHQRRNRHVGEGSQHVGEEKLASEVVYDCGICGRSFKKRQGSYILHKHLILIGTYPQIDNNIFPQGKNRKLSYFHF